MVQGDTVKEEEEIINNEISEQDEFKYRTRPEQPPLKNELQQNNRYLLSVDKAPRMIIKNASKKSCKRALIRHLRIHRTLCRRINSKEVRLLFRN